VLLCSLAVLAACSVAPPGTTIHDPYENANRRVHAFNKSVDTAVLRAVGRQAAIIPEPVRRPVENFADNVSLPGKVVNGLLQADIGSAGINTMRFALNTTVGLFGLFDPAGVIGLDEQDTDFGETLAVWGIPEGAYVELPLLGPSNERDAFGRIVDALIDPLSRYGNPVQNDYGTAARIAEKIIDRGVYGDTLDSVLYESADSYAQSRLIYLQNRRFELGEAATEAYIDPYDDFIDPYEDLE
jgi:phospholipid-binding lipoprotein MlaA